MARLASDAKMGFYPTPLETLDYISRFIGVNDEERNIKLLDPCCGNGKALHDLAVEIGWSARPATYGVEQDAERAIAASGSVKNVVNSSTFDVRINPLGCMGLLWLNPPYGSDGIERYEMRFLKHSIKWLCEAGILVYLVPESLFEREKDRQWIAQNFYDCQVFRFHREDYPRFRQAVLIGKKRAKLGEGEIPPPPYPHIEDKSPSWDDPDPPPFTIPETDGPDVFQGSDAVTDEEVSSNRSRLIEEVVKITGNGEGIGKIKPLLPLRKGHLVALLTAGFLDGRIETPEGPIWLRGFSDRVSSTRVEENKEITRYTYSVGIRVIEQGGSWYDIK